MLGEPIEIAIGIAIEIEKHSSTNVLDPDPDSDFDPEKNVLRLFTKTSRVGFDMLYQIRIYIQ
ncbi:MAG: hypothetical protein JRD49_15200 [Deltaproteobacteria bacterium]|nr:hypothetical protein [Deltaproteobacteria bacterium]MBW2678895.1 hypothetical protein [Deltaproteobacteria bacterium]